MWNSINEQLDESNNIILLEVAEMKRMVQKGLVAETTEFGSVWQRIMDEVMKLTG
ncbi:unnamed protein product [Brugia pahangi]|uniref:DHC_N2 domain-containing protein n=1 Tax=Brugia pahangi TaxID=6280 RepID=A0A0N4TU34_BRUPA|nr:unnamed protein product [Brugia pahangi]